MKFNNENERKLWEDAVNAYVISEGQNEDLAKKVLASVGKEGDFDDLVKIDPTSKNKYLPVIAHYYINGIDIDALKYIFDKVPSIENQVKISPQRTKKGVVWNKGNNLFNIKAGEPVDFIKFSEQVDKITAALNQKRDLKNSGKGKPVSIKNADGSDPNLIFDKNGIKIYKAYSQGACVQYSKGQSFCIGNPGGGMYNTYRDQKDSSFHFVFDENMPYPLSTVVVDNTRRGIELTDEINDTGTIANPEYPEDEDDREDYTEEYLDYLRSKGVDMSIFKNNPYTDEERSVKNIVSNYYSLEEFGDKILGKTIPLPNGDVVDLTLEWLIKNGNRVDPDYWNAIITHPVAKTKRKDYEWRLSTSGYEILEPVLETFGENNIYKYALSQLELDDPKTLPESIFNKLTSEHQSEYMKKSIEGLEKGNEDNERLKLTDFDEYMIKRMPTEEIDGWLSDISERNYYYNTDSDLDEGVGHILPYASADAISEYAKFIFNNVSDKDELDGFDVVDFISPELMRELVLDSPSVDFGEEILTKLSKEGLEEYLMKAANGHDVYDIEYDILERLGPNSKVVDEYLKKAFSYEMEESGSNSISEMFLSRAKNKNFNDYEANRDIEKLMTPEDRLEYLKRYMFYVLNPGKDYEETEIRDLMDLMDPYKLDRMGSEFKRYSKDKEMLSRDASVENLVGSVFANYTSPEAYDKKYQEFLDQNGYKDMGDVLEDRKMIYPLRMTNKMSDEVRKKYFKLILDQYGRTGTGGRRRGPAFTSLLSASIEDADKLFKFFYGKTFGEYVDSMADISATYYDTLKDLLQKGLVNPELAKVFYTKLYNKLIEKGQYIPDEVKKAVGKDSMTESIRYIIKEEIERELGGKKKVKTYHLSTYDGLEVGEKMSFKDVLNNSKRGGDGDYVYGSDEPMEWVELFKKEFPSSIPKYVYKISMDNPKFKDSSTLFGAYTPSQYMAPAEDVEVVEFLGTVDNVLSENKITVYRGSGNNYSDGSNPIKWVALDKSVARNYALDDKGVEELEIEEPTSVFELPFKTNVDVKVENITDNIRSVVGDKFKKGEIDIYLAKSVLKKLKEYEDLVGGEMFKFHSLINDQKFSGIFKDIVYSLGFDAIGIYETNDEGNKSLTYGLI